MALNFELFIILCRTLLSPSDALVVGLVNVGMVCKESLIFVDTSVLGGRLVVTPTVASTSPVEAVKLALVDTSVVSGRPVVTPTVASTSPVEAVKLAVVDTSVVSGRPVVTPIVASTSAVEVEKLVVGVLVIVVVVMSH